MLIIKKSLPILSIAYLTSLYALPQSIAAIPKFKNSKKYQEIKQTKDKSLLNRLEKRFEDTQKDGPVPVKTESIQRAPIMARSLMLSRLIQLLDIDGYGCWCNFGDPSRRLGSGEPIDEFDKFCQNLHLGYECAILDSLHDPNQSKQCVPWEVSYKFANARNDLHYECNLRNEDPCAVNACIVELTFVTEIMMKYQRNEMPDSNYKHKNFLFDPSIQCKGGNSNRKTSSSRYLTDEESQLLANDPDFQKFVKENSHNDNSGLSIFDKEQLNMLEHSVEEEFFLMKEKELQLIKIQQEEEDMALGRSISMSKPPKYSSFEELIANLPIKFQESFSNVLINNNSGHQKSKSSSSKLEILNKSCCGIYPNRRPYTLGNLQKGSIRMCCGEKTYNPAKLECCRGSILMKRCPVGIEVTYNIY